MPKKALTLTPTPNANALNFLYTWPSCTSCAQNRSRRQVSERFKPGRMHAGMHGPGALLPCAQMNIYIAAERCSEWRIRVKELTQTMADPSSLAALLHEVDQANTALQGWQQYASGGTLFQALGLPPSSSSRWNNYTANLQVRLRSVQSGGLSHGKAAAPAMPALSPISDLVTVNSFLTSDDWAYPLSPAKNHQKLQQLWKMSTEMTNSAMEGRQTAAVDGAGCSHPDPIWPSSSCSYTAVNHLTFRI
eukprot:1156903-Pelagomonas_calceolata.AAC.2